MFKMFLVILGFIFIVFKIVLALLIIFSPLILSIFLYNLYMKKDIDGLAKLRKNDDWRSKWKSKSHQGILYEEDYNLKFNDYLQEFNKPKYYIRKILILLLWIFTISNFAYVIDSQKETMSYTRNLHSFEDNQGFYIRGGAFRGSSGTDELVYYYTLKNGDDFKSYRAEASMCSITYSKSTPKVEYFKSREDMLKGKWYNPIVSHLIKIGDNNGWMLDSIKFYIPDGSVQNTYSSDLK